MEQNSKEVLKKKDMKKKKKKKNKKQIKIKIKKKKTTKLFKIDLKLPSASEPCKARKTLRRSARGSAVTQEY